MSPRRLPAEVQRAIEQRLSGKAIQPQAIVTVGKSVNNVVTVTGEAIGGARVPLSLKGDRLLDLIAAVGGSHAPVFETFRPPIARRDYRDDPHGSTGFRSAREYLCRTR